MSLWIHEGYRLETFCSRVMGHPYHSDALQRHLEALASAQHRGDDPGDCETLIGRWPFSSNEYHYTLAPQLSVRDNRPDYESLTPHGVKLAK